MGTLRIVSVSGGKDSTALYLWAIQNFGQDFTPIFCDTNHEHPVTLNYLRNLPEMAKGPPIVWVKADFTPELERKGIAPTGDVFLDMMLYKGRAPSPRAQFCTKELKLHPLKVYVDSIRGDRDVENYLGIRAQESVRRSMLPMKEFDDYLGGWLFRPLLKWDVKDVFLMHEIHQVPPNPLYEAGYSRVGCFPCIHAKKYELARLPDWAWNKLASWEAILGRTFFGKGIIPNEDLPTIGKVRLWSKTKHGGKEVNPNAPDVADVPACPHTFGICE